MRDKIYEILKITNSCKGCRECPLYNICDDKEIDICTYLEELNGKLIEEECLNNGTRIRMLQL